MVAPESAGRILGFLMRDRFIGNRGFSGTGTGVTQDSSARQHEIDDCIRQVHSLEGTTGIEAADLPFEFGFGNELRLPSRQEERTLESVADGLIVEVLPNDIVQMLVSHRAGQRLVDISPVLLIPGGLPSHVDVDPGQISNRPTSAVSQVFLRRRWQTIRQCLVIRCRSGGTHRQLARFCSASARCLSIAIDHWHRATINHLVV